MPFTAGQKLRASELNVLGGVVARVAADLAVTNSTVLVDATGLSFALAANSEYVMDGALSYLGPDAADIKIAFTGPTGMTVTWSPSGPPATIAATSVGTVDFYSVEVYGDPNTFPLGTWSAAPLAARPSGYWKTGVTAGTLQLRWAQNTANVAASTIKRGSWLRLYRFA